jgi:hypothetical protein
MCSTEAATSQAAKQATSSSSLQHRPAMNSQLMADMTTSRSKV